MKRFRLCVQRIENGKLVSSAFIHTNGCQLVAETTDGQSFTVGGLRCGSEGIGFLARQAWKLHPEYAGVFWEVL